MSTTTKSRKQQQTETSTAKNNSSKDNNASTTANEQLSNKIHSPDTEYIDDYRQIMLSYDTTPRKTDPIMTLYEKSCILGKRATQIAMGAEPLIDVPARITNVIEIAEEELRQKKTPFIIRRDLGNNKYEYWKIKDMIVTLD